MGLDSFGSNQGRCHADIFSCFCRNYKVDDEKNQGSHSTEENVLTVRDLKNIFVDD